LTEHGILHIEYWQAFKRDKSVSAFLRFILFALTEFLCLNLSKKIIVDTDYVKQKLKGITFRKLVVIPQGIDDSFYKLNDNPQETTIVSIGAISHRKGYEYSIKAIDLVKKQIPNIRYEIIGVLHDDCKLYYEKLLRFVYDNNLKNNVTFHVNISAGELRRILESANVFVLHSAEESQGIVFCEAMAARKPIVATNVGGIPHVVQNNINGLLSKFGDTTIFANNIIEIIKDKQLRQNMSNQSYRLSQDYNWTNIIKKILNLYVE
jgi:glycosyltransferase involved in cell wall biosynthesis